MTGIANILTAIGDHFGFIVVACIEILAAVILIGTAVARNGRKSAKTGKRAGQSNLSGMESKFLEGYNAWEDEGCLIIRRSDVLPVYMSDGFSKMTGLSLVQLQEDIHNIGLNMADPEQEKAIWKQYSEWDGKEPMRTQMKLIHGNSLGIACRRSRDGMYDFVCTYEMTSLYEKIEQYEKQLAEAEEASQSKTSFLYRMSHEIRTPMNGIMGMLTLAEGKLEPEAPAMQYLTKTEELADHLLALINDILDMSRIEAGKVELEHKPFSLRTMGQRLYDMFAKNLESRGIRYEVLFEDVTVDYVVGDELRLDQVIINFLSNAVKFTSEGEIVVTFRQMMIHEETMDLMISVRDTGIGMDPAYVQRIFRPFDQEHVDTVKKFGGTGLGMAITDQIIKLMGGDIVIHTLPGKGSDFSVFLHLPVARQEEIQKELQSEMLITDTDVSQSVFYGRRILMAEDNEINALVAEEILGNMGAQVDVVENGKLAVEQFASKPASYYDFILMDIQMPVMNGREATERIRELDHPDAEKILIFGLSADAFVEDERKSIACGMNAHYAKPIDFDALQKNIGAFLQKTKV